MKTHLSDYKFSRSSSQPDGYPEYEALLKIRCSLDGENIAEALFLINYTEKTIKPLEIGVHVDHRRRGVATNIYSLAEEVSGFVMIPSDDASDDAEAFWAQPGRPFAKS